MNLKLKILMIVIITFILFSTSVSATKCTLKSILLNQDPYPAVPGDNIKIVFQVNGVDNPTCGTVTFTLEEEFPFSLEPGKPKTQSIQAGTFSTFQFPKHWLVPFTLIVDEAAIDGENQIKASLRSTPLLEEVKEFNITIENLLADFEVSIKDFNKNTNILTFEILNIGESDAEAVTIEIPKQDNIIVKGSKRNIVGSLDANEDTTFDFEAIPVDGEIRLTVLYTDSISTRRVVESTVNFDSSYFTDRKRDEKKTPMTYYIIGLIVVIIILIWIRRIVRNKKKKKMQKL